MKLTTQKRIAANIMDVGVNRVIFQQDRLSDIKEAITKEDLRALINEGVISKKPIKGISSFRSKKIKKQKSKGRRKGTGSREGRRKARIHKKKEWMAKVRTQRKLIKLLKTKEVITSKIYNTIYKKVKGGFFRSKRHIKIFLEDHNLIKKK